MVKLLVFSKKYDFMMGDLRTNPYKIAQVIKLPSNPNLTHKDNVFLQAKIMYLCKQR